jgi:sulfur-carrier protein adenylyltransferase/sulfurtransferase
MFDKLKKMFTLTDSMDAQQARAFIDSHQEGTYTLLDVRQPGEYENRHIPGSTLIPLPELSDSYDNLDREKPVIVY